MAIVRSVQMDEIDPVFLETSYALPENGGEHSHGLFYLMSILFPRWMRLKMAGCGTRERFGAWLRELRKAG
jgi:hypothetical protein